MTRGRRTHTIVVTLTPNSGKNTLGVPGRSLHHADKELTGKAISDLRFSSPRQELDDSVRRQLDVRDRWLARHPKITLDESIVYQDLGRSGFRGKHRVHDKAALKRLLSHVEDGTIRPGTWLLCESLDRLIPTYTETL